jgi:hypothetical protein
MYTFDEQIVSDLHKDARGYRPTEYFWEEWNQCGDLTRQAMWDNLLEELAEETARQKDAYARAEIEFHQRVQGMMLLGAEDELTAIRWILAAEQFTEFDLAYGSDYVAWHFGLPYKGLFDQQIQAVLNEMETQADLG